MTQTKLPRHGIRYLLARPTEPVRPVTGCDTCNDGCDCEGGIEGGIEGIGCGHHGCWGRAATNDCAVGVPVLHEHYMAWRQYRNDLYAYDMQSHLR